MHNSEGSCKKKLGKEVVEEVRWLLQTSKHDIEENLVEYHKGSIRRTFWILGAYVLSGVVLIQVLQAVRKNPIYPQLEAFLLIPQIACVIITWILMRWIHIGWVRNLMLILIFIPIFYYMIITINTIIPYNTPSAFYTSIGPFFKFSLFAQFKFSSLSYHRFEFQVPFRILIVFILIVATIGFRSTKVFCLYFTSIAYLLYVFFHFMRRHSMYLDYYILCQNKNNISEILRLIEAISFWPIYVLKLHNHDKLILCKGEQSPRQDELRTLLEANVLEVFYNSSQGREINTTCELFVNLEEIYFDKNSSLVITRNKREVNIDEYISEHQKQQEEKSAIMSVLKEIHEVEYIGQNVSEIILDMLGILLDYDLTHLDFQFCLRSVTNNQLLDHTQFKFFDIDVMFVIYDHLPALIVVVKDTSERLILDNLEMQGEGMNLKLSSVTHDMRAPLHAIMGYAENLSYKISQFKSPSDTLMEYSSKITANCEHLNTLINDILDSARMAKGKLTLNITGFDLIETAQECFDIVRTTHDNSKLEFKLKGPKSLMIYNDLHRVKRLLLNVLSNSVKYTQKGTISMELNEMPKTVLIRIVDTSSEIDKKTQKKMFHLFMNHVNEDKPSESTKRRGLSNAANGKTFEGARVNLGLYAARELVERLGPYKKINIESKIGVGTTFMFEIYKLHPEGEVHDDVVIILPKEPLTSIAALKKKGKSIHLHGLFNGIGSERKDQILKKEREESPKLQEGVLSRAESLRHISKHASQAVSPMPYLVNHLASKKEKEARKPSPKTQNKTHSTGFADFEKSELRRFAFHQLEEDEPGLLYIMPVTIPKKPLEPATPFSNRISFCKRSSARHSSNKKKEVALLILEDDTFNRDILNMFLMRYFHKDSTRLAIRIDMRVSVPEALDLVREHAHAKIGYSLVFTDYHLGEGLTGPDFVKEVKSIYSNERLVHPSFILVSGNQLTNPDEIVLFSKCILKPFSFDYFSSEMDKWVDLYGSNLFSP